MKKEYAYSSEEISELYKCSQDPIYFIENYCIVSTLDGPKT